LRRKRRNDRREIERRRPRQRKLRPKSDKGLRRPRNLLKRKILNPLSYQMTILELVETNRVRMMRQREKSYKP
jgi:hypothetical protein